MIIDMRTFALAAALTSTALASAQYVDLGIRPLGLFTAHLRLSAELPLSERFGVEPSLSGQRFGLDIGDVSFRQRGFEVGLNPKYYFDPEEGTDGFYGFGYVRYRRFNFNDPGDDIEGDDFTQTRLAAGLGVGYKFVFDNGLILEVGGGPGYALINEFDFEGEEVDLIEVDGPLRALVNLDVYGRVSLGFRLGDR